MLSQLSTSFNMTFVGTPRGGAPSRLPSARAITQGLKGSAEPPSLFASHQLPLWGQFLAHDLTKLGELKGKFEI